jgi:putative DNA primase/helicase
LSEETITLISGERGCGKSWFVFGVLDAIVSKNKFGPWEGINDVPVLYLDGEMGKRMIQKRLEILKIDSENFYILNNHKTLDDGGVTANITNEGYRDWIQKEMLKKGIKIFAVDNVSCLCPGLNENSKEDWDDINQWLIRLKHLGISTILIHHLGKDKISARGTSGREDNIDISIILRKPKNYKVTDKARFQVVFTKHRQDVEDPEAISDLEFKLVDKKWEVKNSKTASEDQVAALFHDGSLNQSEIAEVVGITKGQVSKIKSKLIKAGLLDKETKKLIGKQSADNIFDK